jgi:hypothetical protein
VTANPVSLVPAEDPGEWDVLVDRDPRATPFHRWGFIVPLVERAGWRFRPQLVMADGAAVGVLPVLASGTVAVTPSPLTPYIGPLVPPALLADTMRALRSWQIRAPHVLARAAFSPLEPQAPDLGRRFDVEAHPTYVLDLSHGDVERYAAALTADRRANLRRAVRRGVTTRPSEPGEASRLLPEVMRTAFARHDAIPAEVVAIGAFVDDLLTRDDHPLIAETVLVDGLVVGIQIAVQGYGSGYGWVGGVRQAALHTSAGSLAYDAVLRRAIATGVQRFDFVGYVDEGVAKFKRSFGATEERAWNVRSSLVPRAVSEVRGRIRRRAEAAA